MRPNIKKYLAIFSFLLFSMPIYASHKDSVSWAPTQPVTIGDVDLKPGDYVLKADEEEHEVQIIQDHKVITTVLCYWEDLPNKAADTEVKVDNNEVTEMQFKGRPEAIVFIP